MTAESPQSGAPAGDAPFDISAPGLSAPVRKRSTWTPEERARLQAALDRVHTTSPSSDSQSKVAASARQTEAGALPALEVGQPTSRPKRSTWSAEERERLQAALDRVHERVPGAEHTLRPTESGEPPEAPRTVSTLSLDGRAWTEEQRATLLSALADLRATRLAASQASAPAQPKALRVPAEVPAAVNGSPDLAHSLGSPAQGAEPLALPEVIEDPPLPEGLAVWVDATPPSRAETAAADEPVSVGAATAPAPEYALPKPPPVALPRWYGPGEPVEVHGLRLPGLVRVAAEQPKWLPLHASTIALWLPVDLDVAPGEVQPRPEAWVPPGYAALSPAERGLYLKWLAAGRTFGVSPGLALLFLSCLESRLREVGADAILDAELSAIVHASRAVVAQYGPSSPMLQEYGMNFACFLEAVRAPPQLYLRKPPDMPVSYEVPALLQVAMGQVARDGQCLPPEWALAFVRCDPHASRRTPVRRCPAEFEALFSIRFEMDFPQGLKPRAMSRKPLTLLYRCMPERTGDAQASLAVDVVLAANARLSEPQVAQLRETAEWCSERLATYSRFLGREPAAEGTADAAVRLPAELLKRQLAARLAVLVNLAGAAKVVSTEQAWQELWGQKPSRKDSVPFLRALLESVGLKVLSTAEKSVAKGSAPAVTANELRLDPRKLEQVRQDDAAATRLMAVLFADVDESAHGALPASKSQNGRTVLPDLDDEHFELLTRLLTGADWSRESLQRAAQGLGLMLDGALERINEIADELCGDRLVIDDGVFEVDMTVALQMREALQQG